MQEIAILLGSLTGIAVALFIKQFSRYKSQVKKQQTIQQNTFLPSLEIERNILIKSIKKLKEDDNLSSYEQTTLLHNYEHQLGVVQNKIETFESSNQEYVLQGQKLVLLLEEKLSNVDKRLQELTTKVEPVINSKDTSDTNTSTPQSIPTIVPIPSTPITQPESLPQQISTPISSTPIPSTPITQPESLPQQISTPISSTPISQHESSSDKILPINNDILQILPVESLPPDDTQELIQTNDEIDLEEIKSEIFKTISKLEKSEID